MWNEKAAEHFETWSRTPSGSHAVECRDQLLRRLVYGWPRRGRKIAVLGCGVGTMLRTLWEDGFDVTGFDVSQALLRHAEAQLGDRVEYRLGVMDDLPFEDGEFDYTVIPYCYDFFDNSQTILNESVRIAACGAAVLFFNRFSLLPFNKKAFPASNEAHCTGTWPWTVYTAARRADSAAHLTMRTVMPTLCKNQLPLWKKINELTMPIPLGMIAGLRIDKIPNIPFTPIPLTENSFQSESY